MLLLWIVLLGWFRYMSLLPEVKLLLSACSTLAGLSTSLELLCMSVLGTCAMVWIVEVQFGIQSTAGLAAVHVVLFEGNGLGTPN